MSDREKMKQANALITAKLAQVAAILKECEAVADAAGVTFYISPGGYGSGSTYYPKGSPDWESSDEESANEGHWQSSSVSC